MLGFVVRRVLYTIPLLLLISMIVFVIIKLEPGNFCTPLRLQDPALYQRCLETTGIDRPLPFQYGQWLWGILSRFDFGYSFANQQPVLQQLFTAGNWQSGTPLLWTLILSFGTMLLIWLIAVPIGIYAATQRGSWRDSGINLLGFIGLSIPNFTLAIALLWLLVVVFQVGSACWPSAQLGQTVCLGVSGLFDGDFVSAPWSWEKVLDLLWHLWPAILVIGAANLAAIVRYVRSEMLDVLSQPYIQTARAKGLNERLIVIKHAFKNALNPLIRMIGYWLPSMFEGTLVAAMILQLPIVEKVYWTALKGGDQYVVMAGLLFFSAVLIVGNLIADLLLAWVNPKIRYQ
jgi:peptide/nickel transport system permease protein